ncbi:hypothetical protein HRbin20_01023 [bacterium HR20]|nr:hypothetical protein HRbin20_01023 [bacterium HR20]
MDGDDDVFAESCQRFVNRVIYNFEDQVVQATFPCVSDVHCWAFTNRLKAFECDDAFFGVLCRVGGCFCGHTCSGVWTVEEFRHPDTTLNE